MKLFIFRFFCGWTLAYLVTFYCVPLIIQIAFKFGILDKPDGIIKKHQKPIPYLGGLAIYLGFIFNLAFFHSFENKITSLLIGATLLLMVGLLDDLIRMKPYQKLCGQLVATFCFLKSGFYLKEYFFLNNLWSMPLSLLWILSIINAFNLVDIMDGLATVLAINSTLAFICFAIFFGQYNIALFLMLFLGSLCAFLWFNKPPAAIYMGDAGSLYIGGFLATVPFLLPWNQLSYYGYLAPIIILGIPLLEIASLIVIRTYKRIPFYYGSPDHFALYLQRNGWTKNSILSLVSAISCLLNVIAACLVCNVLDLFSLAIVSSICLILWFLLLNYKFILSRVS